MNTYSKRILIIQGHEVLRQALCRWLETTFPGCQVIESASAEEALAAQINSLDVIVTDVSLPGMSGLEATAHLKTVFPGTPVVLLTSYETEAQQAHALINGASAYISKAQITRLQSALADLLAHPIELVEF